jgi:cytochrome c oxidase subunit 1
MAVTETPPETEAAPAVEPPARRPGELERLLGTGDHTTIGRLYVGISLLFLISALVARAVLAIDQVLSDGFLGAWARLFDSSSLVALLVLGVVPLLLGIAIHMVPLQVGSPTIAFPRAAALSLWAWVVFGGIFLTSAALRGGIGGSDVDAAELGNVALGGVLVALGLASVCVATTVMVHRPAGMTLARVPLFTWSMLVACSVWIVSFGAALAPVVLGAITAESADGLFDNFTSGLGWLVRGPAVYMVAIPVLGIAGDAVATATHRPLRNYGLFQGLIGAFGVLSFGAWAQGPVAINTVVWVVAAIGVGAPLVLFLGGLAESMRHGRVALGAPLVGSLLALVNLLGAVAVGALMALDTAGTGTLFDFPPQALSTAQATFAITAAVTGALAGLAHWSVKVWGSLAEDRLATLSIVLADLGGGLLGTTYAVQVLVQADDPRAAHALFGILAAAGVVAMLAGVVGALVAYLGAASEGAEGPEDPFEGLTLEWRTPSPAIGGVRTGDPVEISSPYPFAPTEEGN